MAVLWGLERLLLTIVDCLVFLIKFVLPGLKGLSRKLNMSLSRNSAYAPSLSGSLESDLVLFETKARLYNNNLSKHAKEND